MAAMNLTISYRGRPVGHTVLPATAIKGEKSETQLTFEARQKTFIQVSSQVFLSEADEEGFIEFGRDCIRLKEVSLSMQGTATITAVGLSVSTNLAKDVSIPGVIFLLFHLHQCCTDLFRRFRWIIQCHYCLHRFNPLYSFHSYNL